MRGLAQGTGNREPRTRSGCQKTAGPALAFLALPRSSRPESNAGPSLRLAHHSRKGDYPRASRLICSYTHICADCGMLSRCSVDLRRRRGAHPLLLAFICPPDSSLRAVNYKLRFSGDHDRWHSPVVAVLTHSRKWRSQHGKCTVERRAAKGSRLRCNGDRLDAWCVWQERP